MCVRGLLVALLFLTCGCTCSVENWWNEQWHYRIPVTVDSGMHDRTDCLVRMPLDLLKIAKEGKLDGAITIESLRVVSVDADKGTSAQVPSVFKKAKDFKPGKDERGMLIWQINGEFSALEERAFRVYLDTSVKPAPVHDPIPGADAEVGVNLVPNSSFEARDENGMAVGWRKYCSQEPVGKAQVTEVAAHSGKRSLHISRPDEKRTYFYYVDNSSPEPIVAKEGRKYQLSGWAKAAGTKEHAIQLYFIGEKGKGLTDYEYTTHCTFSRGDGWLYGRCTLEAPPGSRFVGIRLHCGTPGDVYYDDIELIMLPKIEPPRLKIGNLENIE